MLVFVPILKLLLFFPPLSCSLLSGMSKSEYSTLVYEMSDPESSAGADEEEDLGTEEVQEIERFIEQFGLLEVNSMGYSEDLDGCREDIFVSHRIKIPSLGIGHRETERESEDVTPILLVLLQFIGLAHLSSFYIF